MLALEEELSVHTLYTHKKKSNRDETVFVFTALLAGNAYDVHVAY